MSIGTRTIRAAHSSALSCKGWPQDAALRMLMNNLDPDVAEHPDDLIVYGGSGKAARNWQAFDAIVAALRDLEHDETLLVQSGKPVGIFRTHERAPRVLIVDVDPQRIRRRLETRYLDEATDSVDAAVTRAHEWRRHGRARSIGLEGNASEVLPE